LFQVYLREFNYSFERAGPRLAAGRCFGPPITAARNAPSGVRRVRSPRYHSYHLSNGC
jgi:hypothetical protein